MTRPIEPGCRALILPTPSCAKGKEQYLGTICRVDFCLGEGLNAELKRYAPRWAVTLHDGQRAKVYEHVLLRIDPDSVERRDWSQYVRTPSRSRPKETTHG